MTYTKQSPLDIAKAIYDRASREDVSIIHLIAVAITEERIWVEEVERQLANALEVK